MADEIGAKLRPYDDADLDAVLRFIGECQVLAGGCGYLHPGDFAHHLSNGLRGKSASDSVFIHAEGGQIAAIVILYVPGWFSVMVHPKLRGGELHRALVAWAEGRVVALLAASEEEDKRPGIDVMSCDDTLRDLLLGRGYAPDGEPTFINTTRSLLGDSPAPVLPAGYYIRDDVTEADMVELGRVHSGAFGSNWAGDAYLPVLRSPAYGRGRELVVVAPDGHFAAFLIYWPDPVSRYGLFEPVGCHKDYQRCGLTRALMYDAMRRMRDEDMTGATVIHQIEAVNPASAGLYAAVGFRAKNTISYYRKG